MSTPSFERQMTILIDTPKSYSVEQKRELYDEVYALLDAKRNELEIANITHTYRRGSGQKPATLQFDNDILVSITYG